MSMNAWKTIFMLLKKNDLTNLNLLFYDTSIFSSPETSFLGFTLDYGLKRRVTLEKTGNLSKDRALLGDKVPPLNMRSQ